MRTDCAAGGPDAGHPPRRHALSRRAPAARHRPRRTLSRRPDSRPTQLALAAREGGGSAEAGADAGQTPSAPRPRRPAARPQEGCPRARGNKGRGFAPPRSPVGAGRRDSGAGHRRTSSAAAQGEQTAESESGLESAAATRTRARQDRTRRRRGSQPRYRPRRRGTRLPTPGPRGSLRLHDVETASELHPWQY